MAKRNEAAENRPAVRPVRLTSDMSMPKLSAVEIGSYVAAFAGLFFVLHLQLLGALLAGMLVFQLVHMIAPLIEKTMTSGRARWVSVVIIATSNADQCNVAFIRMLSLGLNVYSD